MKIDGTKTPGERALLEAMEANMLTHMSWVQQRLPETTVVLEPALSIIDSGLSSDTFNFVVRARIPGEELRLRIDAAIGHFTRTGRPFSWWVGPLDQPADLSQALIAAGLAPAEAELGMFATLDTLGDAPLTPAGLQIIRAVTQEQVWDFATAVAGSPPDLNVLAFYESAARHLLDHRSPIRLYVGYLAGEPVASSELCVGGGVVGLYGIATLPSQRRRGFGTALTLRPLLDAREDGFSTAVLQASPEGQHVYARLGFVAVGRFTEYKPT